MQLVQSRRKAVAMPKYNDNGCKQCKLYLVTKFNNHNNIVYMIEKSTTQQELLRQCSIEYSMHKPTHVVY